MELTERILNDAGGWQVMKQARALHAGGRVHSAQWQAPRLEGVVREGETEYRAGLRIVSKTNIENLCTCRDSRQRGLICAHAIAVGLEILKPRPHAEMLAAPVVAAAAPGARTLDPIFSTDAGEPLELFVILPPNLASAWENKSIMVGLEAAVGGKRMLLSALDRTRRFQCSEADARVIETFCGWAGGQLPGMAMLGREQFLEALEVLAEHPRMTFGKTVAVSVERSGGRVPLRIYPAPDGGIRLRVEWPAGAAQFVAGSRRWGLDGTRFQAVARGLPMVYDALFVGDVSLPADAAERFLREELPALREFFAFEESALAPRAGHATALAPAPAFELSLEGSLNHLAARLTVRYGEHRLTLSSVPARTSHARNIAEEQRALGDLQRAGFHGPDTRGELILKGEPQILAFFARELPRWEKRARVEIGARFEHVTRDIDRLETRLEIRSSGETWFDLQVELSTPGGECFSGAEIQRLLHGGQSHLRRKNGKITVFDPAMLDEFQQVLRDCDPAQPQPGLYRIDRRHAPYLESVAEEQGAPIRVSGNWREWARTARAPDGLQAVPLGPLEGTLRPYQKTGVNWMAFLARNGLGGILADEMGLGKTVQALAFLQSCDGKALIVCPSSLVYNWQREAARFTPTRGVLAIVGPDRQALFGAPLAAADLVITSYPLLRRDASHYRGTFFDAAILDEAQHIKNPDSENARAAAAIHAKSRFALTGTPIENSVRDIWSLMHFLMPGYLGKYDDFRERFEKPASENSSGPEHRRLVQRIKPFVLRRTKAEVIPELPDKIIQVAYCELTTKQRTFYNELLGVARREMSLNQDPKTAFKARAVMLTALLRLRQACCDLRLLSAEAVATPEHSSKLELLNELLQEAIDGGHRILVFSQFVSMLQLIRESFASTGMEYCYLDGSTKDRGAEVDRFQNGAAPVFLISLKAGGVGLNLSAADTVIHFDPWWNPAVENQATDRVHRIGQTKVVTAYKLVARGTIEEKILNLQEKKRNLASTTIENEEPLMESLTLADIEGLLE